MRREERERDVARAAPQSGAAEHHKQHHHKHDSKRHSSASSIDFLFKPFQSAPALRAAQRIQIMPSFCNLPKRKFNSLPDALGARLGPRPVAIARAAISRLIRFINRSRSQLLALTPSTALPPFPPTCVRGRRRRCRAWTGSGCRQRVRRGEMGSRCRGPVARRRRT